MFPKYDNRKQGWPWASSGPWLAAHHPVPLYLRGFEPETGVRYWFSPPAVDEMKRTTSVAVLKRTSAAPTKRAASSRRQRSVEWKKVTSTLARASCIGRQSELRGWISISVGVAVLGLGVLNGEADEIVTIVAAATAFSIATWTMMWTFGRILSVLANVCSAGITPSPITFRD